MPWLYSENLMKGFLWFTRKSAFRTVLWRGVHFCGPELELYLLAMVLVLTMLLLMFPIL